jgi:hypothetical protein
MENSVPIPTGDQNLPVQPPPLPVIILSVLVIICFAVTGYLFWQNQQLTARLSQTANPVANAPMQPAATVIPTIADPTAGWKTYVSNKYHYQIKYPPEWTTQIDCEGGIPNDDYVCLESPDLQINPVPAVTGGKLITIAAPGSSEFVINKESTANSAYPAADFCQQVNLDKYQSCNPIKVNGQKMIEKIWGVLPAIDIAILGPDDTIKLTIRLQNAPKMVESDTIFDQILSTFRFTGQNHVDMTGWNIFTGPTFTLKYPTDWVQDVCSDVHSCKTDDGPLDTWLSPKAHPTWQVIWVTHAKSTLSAKDWFMKNHFDEPSVMSLLNTDNSSINGYDAYSSEINMPDEISLNAFIVISHNGNIVDLSMPVQNNNSNPDLRNTEPLLPVFNQIAQSVNFLQ